ncbi:hypothetical protein [Mesoplasma lactucae]|uniref:Uncharacterized protein n=1 Tax=Mesoplasma lactucae ATCC 49193 TaxID=81460 RepID=A0A291IR57_9MOLU|nr:hypothetical protein [Mesoplasma lactucae]ATG97425.1 hypothetical protein CP520_01460 [Mesoplasma lactucae ATCC 49193]ATZ20122.1 hypothetical protein MLACT_v1c03010 [Mesoplasma lactucae ATCC 49193]MCL8216870.1 hypothetical protein [Mesoplasma lactucae ATCC 49193]
MSFNKKYLWATIAILIYGVFGIIALEAIGYRASGEVISLHQFNTSSEVSRNIYGLGVSALVFSWLGLIIPLMNMFWDKTDSKYTLWTLIGMEALSLILFIASISLFASKFHGLDVNGGAVFGQFLMVFVGAGAAGAGIYFSYFRD